MSLVGRDLRAQVVRTILAVDDEDANRQLLSALLASQGYRVLLAESGVRALELVQSERVDLVLLDLMMPHMDGIEVCQALRGRLQLHNLPIIFVTALNDRESRVRGKEAGADDFLEKPIDALELLIRIENLLRLRSYQEVIEAQARQLARELDVANTGLMRVQRQRPGTLLAAGVASELDKLARNASAVAAKGHELPAAALLEKLSQLAHEVGHHAAALQTFARRGARTEELMDLGDVVNEVAGRIARPVTFKDEICVSVTHDTRPKLRMNRPLLEHMVESLLQNAVDAASSVPGREPQVSVSVETMAGSGAVRVTVADNGVGMDEATLARACEPYFRARGQGAGIGLCLVRNAVDSLGGSLRLQTKPGLGTTALIELPAQREEQLV